MQSETGLGFRAFIFLFGLFIIRAAMSRVREGGCSLYGKPIERAQDPAAFWAIIGIALFTGVFFIASAVLLP